MTDWEKVPKAPYYVEVYKGPYRISYRVNYRGKKGVRCIKWLDEKFSHAKPTSDQLKEIIAEGGSAYCPRALR